MAVVASFCGCKLNLLLVGENVKLNFEKVNQTGSLMG